MLMTETAKEMSDRIIRAAKFILGPGCYKTDFEHGQWWVTRPGSYEQWSVVDCQTQGGVDYLDFEQVTRGDEE